MEERSFIPLGTGMVLLVITKLVIMVILVFSLFYSLGLSKVRMTTRWA